MKWPNEVVYQIFPDRFHCHDPAARPRPGAFLWKDASVKLDTVLTNLTTGLFGGASFTLNRFTGPGRVGIQSMSYHPPQPGSAEQTNPGDALVRSVVKGLFD